MLNEQNTRQYLRESEFENLFIEELLWDRHTQTLPVTVDETTYQITAIAHKRGVVAFECPAPGTEERIPDYATRRKIQKQVAKSVHEHLPKAGKDFEVREVLSTIDKWSMKRSTTHHLLKTHFSFVISLS